MESKKRSAPTQDKFVIDLDDIKTPPPQEGPPKKKMKPKPSKVSEYRAHLTYIISETKEDGDTETDINIHLRIDNRLPGHDWFGWCFTTRETLSTPVVAAWDEHVSRFPLDEEGNSATKLSMTPRWNTNGILKLGQVSGERKEVCVLDATFNLEGNDFDAQVFVRKDEVPEGHRNKWDEDHALPSIEPVPDQEVEEELKWMRTVVFEGSLLQKRGLTVELWQKEGKNCSEGLPAKMIEYKKDGDFANIKFKVQDDGGWKDKDQPRWIYFSGRIHRDMKHGRFLEVNRGELRME